MAAIKSELIFYGTTTPNVNSQLNEKITELENKINAMEIIIPTKNSQLINDSEFGYQRDIDKNINDIADIFNILESNGFTWENISENKTINLTNLGKGTYVLKF